MFLRQRRLPQKKKEGSVGKQDRYTYTYRAVDEYNPRYVNGAYGGIGPGGEVVVNFYLERHALPNVVEYAIGAGGEVGDVVHENPPHVEHEIVRVVESGIVMNLETTRRIYDWLGEVIKAAAKS